MKIDWFAIFCVGCLLAVACAIIYGFFFVGSHAIPISGLVVEKAQVGTGYSHNMHILQIEIKPGSCVWITVSARVYLSVVEGVRYEFNGPRLGDSYDSAKVIEGE